MTIRRTHTCGLTAIRGWYWPQNCRLGSSLSRILLKNNTLNSFKLLERPAPEELCYRLLSPASLPVPSQQHHSGVALWYFTALPGYCCYKFPSQMHHFGLVLSLPILTLCKTLHKELQPLWFRDRRKVPRSAIFAFEASHHQERTLTFWGPWSADVFSGTSFPCDLSPCPIPKAWAPFKDLFSFKFLTTLNAVVRAVLLKYCSSGASQLSCPLIP